VESVINMKNAVNFSIDDGRKFFVKLDEQREYNEVQSTVLTKGRRYSTVLCADGLLRQLSTLNSANNDAGVTGVS